MPKTPHHIALVDKVDQQIREHLQPSPLLKSTDLSALAGARTLLKVDSLQGSGSFKIRGALAFFASMKQNAYQEEVVAACDGNQAKAIAKAAHLHEHACRLFLPDSAGQDVIDYVSHLGATVDKKSINLDQCQKEAREYSLQHNLQYLCSQDNPMVLAGYATAAKEILAQFPDEKIGSVVLPIGSGACCVALGGLLKQERPNIAIIGVQSDHLCGGPPSNNMADLLDDIVDEVLSVKPSSVDKAVSFLFHQHHLVVEPAGAMTVAAMLEESVSIHSRRAILYLSGGNLNQTDLTKLLLEKRKT